MSLQSMFVHRQTKAYHKHQHLLIQFIWSELILASEHTNQALDILTELLETDKKIERDILVNSFTKHVTLLAGSAYDYMRLFAWKDDGIFAKMKNYSSLFTKEQMESGESNTDMSREANKAWLLSLEALDIMRLDFNVEALISIFTKIQKSLVRLKRYVSQAAMQFSSDENVLLFILRYHESLDNLHRPGFVKKLLLMMYPKGIQGVERVLIKKYSARGFEQLIPFIQSKIEQLQSV